MLKARTVYFVILVVLACAVPGVRGVILEYKYEFTADNADATGSAFASGSVFVDQGAAKFGTFDENDVVGFTFSSGALSVTLDDVNTFSFDVVTTGGDPYTSGTLMPVSLAIDDFSFSFTETVLTPGVSFDTYTINVTGMDNSIDGTSMSNNSLSLSTFQETLFTSNISSGAGETAAIPEPSTAIPVFIVGAMLMAARKRKQQQQA